MNTNQLGRIYIHMAIELMRFYTCDYLCSLVYQGNLHMRKRKKGSILAKLSYIYISSSSGITTLVLFSLSLSLSSGRSLLSVE